MAPRSAPDPRDKRSLRAWARQRRMRQQRQSPDGRESAAERLADRCQHLPAYASARVLAAYLPLSDECSPLALMHRACANGLDLVVPAWNAVARRYAFCRWSPRCELRPGLCNVLEPVRKDWIAPARIDLALVPGLVFDRAGRRIGFGAGHYDRLLARLDPQAFRAGIAWPWQVLPRVPSAPHDVPMHCVLTPGRTWHAAPDAAAARSDRPVEAGIHDMRAQPR